MEKESELETLSEMKVRLMSHYAADPLEAELRIVKILKEYAEVLYLYEEIKAYRREAVIALEKQGLL